MVDARDSKSRLARGESSSLSSGTWRSKRVFTDILKEQKLR